MCDMCIHKNVCKNAKENTKCNMFLSKDTVVMIPCPVGTTLYRIEEYTRKCSFHSNTRDNLYYCVNDYMCKHIIDGKCDCGKKYRIYTIKNASLETIVCNREKIGKTVFTDLVSANVVLERLQKEEYENMMKTNRDIPDCYAMVYDFSALEDDEDKDE